MDLAVVLAALAGLAGAAIGGYATAYGARIGAQKSIEAVGVQVAQQSEAEHSHWVRENRRQACTDTLDAYVACTMSLVYCRAFMREGAELPAELINDASDKTDILTVIQSHLQLWGPERLVTLSGAMAEAAGELLHAIREWPAIYTTLDDSARSAHLEECAELASVIAGRRWAFVEDASRILGMANEPSSGPETTQAP
ncbi:hypothetical protein [Streptomyces lavendulocolor]|uniref:hypothetical protein n=1 Tax=Streptomyces lavendulocolor TaxID=67316 RepID=UPI003C2FE728